MVAGVWRAAALATASVVAGSETAHADAALSGNVSLTSDYVFRGVSQSDEHPAIQGGFDYTNDLGDLPVYVGVWSSSVDFGSTVDSGIEVDVYTGIRPDFGPVSMDLGVIAYFFPGSDIDDLDYVEFKAGISGNPFEPLTLDAAMFFSPEYALNGDQGINAELRGAYEFNEHFSLSAAVANQSVDAAGFFVGPGASTDNYTAWNVGGTGTAYGFSVDVRYYDTNEDILNFDGDVVSDARVVVTLTREL